MYYFIIYIILVLCIIYYAKKATYEKFVSNNFISLERYPELDVLKENHEIIVNELNYIFDRNIFL